MGLCWCTCCLHMPNICLLGKKHFPQQKQGHRKSQPNPRLLQAPGSGCQGLLQLGSASPSVPQGSSASVVRKHRAKVFTATAAPVPLFHFDIRSLSPTPHSPSGQSGESSQAQHRVRAAKNWIFYHTVSFLPIHWVTSGHRALEQSCQLPGLPSVRAACTGKCCLQHTPMGSVGNACGKLQEKWDLFPGSLSLVL